MNYLSIKSRPQETFFSGIKEIVKPFKVGKTVLFHCIAFTNLSSLHKFKKIQD